VAVVIFHTVYGGGCLDVVVQELKIVTAISHVFEIII
jgi:hypothetical protein